MARKQYQVPTVEIFKVGGGNSGGEDLPASGQEGVFTAATTSFSGWKMAVQNANLDIDSSYAGYVKWMTENGYGAYIQPDDSELQ